MTLIVRNRTGSAVAPKLANDLSEAFGELPVEVLIADETIKMNSTELLIESRARGLQTRVIRARSALREAIDSASAPFTVIIDIDERHPLKLIPQMLFEAEAQQADLVVVSSRSNAPRAVRRFCGAAVRGIGDPLTPFFLARTPLFEDLKLSAGATVLALDLLLAHPYASTVEIEHRVEARRGSRRSGAETIHVIQLMRRGARARAHGARVKVRNATLSAQVRAAHPSVRVALALIVIAGALLRFWALPSLHWFSHDEAHAAFAAYRLMVQHKPVLQGQPTSRGVYLGPGYYYLVAPFYLMFGMSPFGGAFLAAIAGLGAVWLCWRIGREVFGQATGLAAAAIMATAPIAVYFSRFGWNPNTLPFFAALFIYALIVAERSRTWLIVAAFCAGLAPQLHATGLILPMVLCVWLIMHRPRMKKRTWGLMLFAFGLPLLPMMLGELRTHFAMTKSWIRLLTGHGISGVNTGGSLIGAFKDLLVESIGTPRFMIAGSLAVLSMIGLSMWIRTRRTSPALRTIFIFEIVGALAAVAWHGQMFAYWLLPWLPGAIVLFAGGMIALTLGAARRISRTRRALIAPVLVIAIIAGGNVASIAHPVRLANEFDSSSPIAFQNTAAVTRWIADRIHGPFDLEVFTPYPWDTAHNLTGAFDYLLLRKHLHRTPNASELFIVAMEDVSFPHSRSVRTEAVMQLRTHHVHIVAFKDFGGVSVYELGAA
ncbi:MAG: glycosyltransferase family 39 protein [Actinomycetota bacterium]